MFRSRLACLPIGLACVVHPVEVRAEPSLAAGLQAYQAGDVSQARSIAADHLDQPRGRLVHALCLVHDEEHGDRVQGLDALEQLYHDESAERAVRLEAGLSYGRMIQLLQVRGLHPELGAIDTATFYHEYIALAGDSEYACLAALNLAELYCDDWLLQKDPHRGQQALVLIEGFIAGYQGPRKDLPPLHLLAESLYEEVAEDYRKCYQHLDAAYRLGMVKMQVRRAALLKMGRLNHLKLDDPKQAAHYYQEFLRAFPNARETPQVRRYLAELTAEDR